MAKRILVADDDENILKLLEIILVNEGYDVIKAKDGKEALEKFNKNKMDLAILDVDMPAINGFEVCRNIRIKEEKMPVIILTGKSEGGLVKEGFEAGATLYMFKPFTSSKLLTMVKALIK